MPGADGPVWDAMLAAEIVRLAVSHVGEAESPAHTNRGKLMDLCNQFVGVPLGSPWCAAFACTVINHACASIEVEWEGPRTGSSSEIYHWARKNGRVVTVPRPGDLGLVKGGRGGPEFRHTTIVREVDGDRVLTVEGNEGDKVCRFTRPIKSMSYVRPYHLVRPLSDE